jgi:hypothetical protein
MIRAILSRGIEWLTHAVGSDEMSSEYRILVENPEVKL